MDAEAFADEWRGEYQPAMNKIRSGNRGYVALDTLHRENLEVVLTRRDQLGLFSDDELGGTEPCVGKIAAMGRCAARARRSETGDAGCAML